MAREKFIKNERSKFFQFVGKRVSTGRESGSVPKGTLIIFLRSQDNEESRSIVDRS
jgi:hypothetical protein